LGNSVSKPVQHLCGPRSQRGRKKATSRTPDGKMPQDSRSSPREIQNYLGRISGPLLDRIDLHIEVPAVKFREMSDAQPGETSAQIRERVIAARQVQQQRFAGKPKVTCNARMGARVESVLRTGRGDARPAQKRHDGISFERPRLRPHFESGADHCRPGRRGENFPRSHQRGDPVPLAGPTVVGLTDVSMLLLTARIFPSATSN